ncbi:MAG TPA: hypothetical protein VNV37_02410 [Solirubrobacteraceae bacterium]|nr:hypothetical protein [Solirubrobacteraceae bacterium]
MASAPRAPQRRHAPMLAGGALIAAAAVLLLLVVVMRGGTKQRAPVPAAAGTRTLYVSPRGTDASGCGAQSAPCGSLGAAYLAAAPGDTVLLEGGTYPEQTLAGDPRKRAAAHVTFRPATGAAVSIAGPTYIYASHLTLEDVHVGELTIGNYNQTPGRPNATGVTLRGVVGRDFEIDSATHVRMIGGGWGPDSACGGPYGGDNNSIRDVTGVVPSDIVIAGVSIHDVQSYNLVQCHIEGLAIFAGHDVTVADSRFWGNSVYDVFVQANSGPISDIAFKRNWMATPVGVNGVENGTVIGFSAITANVLVEDNRFNYVISLDDDGLNPVYSNFELIGNVGVLPYAGCTLRGITWVGNVWRNGACSVSDIDLRGAALPYRDPVNGPALDYSLTRRF